MIVPSSAIREQLAAIWPGLKFIVLSDPEWWLPEENDLAAFLADYPTPPYVPHIYECEEFSLDLVAAQRRLHAGRFLAGTTGLRSNWPLGIVCGTRFAGVEMDHWQNICATRAGIRLVEPQTRRIWTPDPARDQIYFLLM